MNEQMSKINEQAVIMNQQNAALSEQNKQQNQEIERFLNTTSTRSIKRTREERERSFSENRATDNKNNSNEIASALQKALIQIQREIAN